MNKLLRFCVVAALLLYSGAAWAAPVPTGAASWYDSATSKIHQAFGPMGAPVLNYQNPDGRWSSYKDEWVLAGQSKVWRSDNGRDAVYTDSTGAFYVRRDMHWLGIRPPQLVKFNTLDSSYNVLAAADPDSVTAAGNVVTFWGIFYGANLRARNNPKILQLSKLEWEFTQAARDSLAKLTPWANRLLATVHRIDADSLGVAAWRDRQGEFTQTASGRMTSGWFDLRSGNERIWVLPPSIITMADTVTAIPVWKRVALIGGNPFFFEAFSPAQTAALPPGSLYHDVKFGHDTGTVSGGANIEGVPYGIKASPPTSGTVDSMAAMLDCGIADHNVTPSLRNWGAWTLVTGGCATEKLIPFGVNDTWYTFTGMSAAVTAGTNYWLNIWGNVTGGTVSLNKGASVADSSMSDIGDTYTSACPALTGTFVGAKDWWLIYCFYTVNAGEPVTFGYDGDAANVYSLLERMDASRFTPEYSGVVDSIGAWVLADATQTFACAIYPWRGTAAIDSAPRFTHGTTTHTRKITASYLNASITAGTWYAICIQASGVNSYWIYATTGLADTDSASGVTHTYGSWPSSPSWPATAGYRRNSVFAIYHIPAGGAAVSGRRRRQQVGSADSVEYRTIIVEGGRYADVPSSKTDSVRIAWGIQ